MDFKLLKNKSELKGTCYFEFLPGKFKDEHWNNNPVFLSEESMFIIEKLFEKNSTDYEHWGFCEINKNELLNLLKDLEERKTAIDSGEIIDLNIRLVNNSFSVRMNKTVQENKDKIVLMIQEFIDWINLTLKENDTISILGI